MRKVVPACSNHAGEIGFGDQSGRLIVVACRVPQAAVGSARIGATSTNALQLKDRNYPRCPCLIVSETWCD